MSISNNTVQGPIYGGNGGPGNNGMYADCFSPLSAIPDQTIPLDMIQGCRIFIAQKSQLYLYFFNQTSIMGYTSPNLQDPTDPNKNIVYEIIELTLNAYGFFGNTTRVDAYHRPIKLELFGESGAYQEIRGDMADHTEIISNFPGSVPSEFQNCLDLQDSIIIQGVIGQQTFIQSFGSRPYNLSKGGKFEINYNDDASDNVTSLEYSIQYYYSPSTPYN